MNAEIRILTDPHDVLNIIDTHANIVPSRESCQRIVSSALFLSALVSDDKLRPQVLLDRLRTISPRLNARWIRDWALGTSDVPPQWGVAAMPIIRGHVADIAQAWTREIDVAPNAAPADEPQIWATD